MQWPAQRVAAPAASLRERRRHHPFATPALSDTSLEPRFHRRLGMIGQTTLIKDAMRRRGEGVLIPNKQFPQALDWMELSFCRNPTRAPLDVPSADFGKSLSCSLQNGAYQ